MRTRLLRPGFFTNPELAALPVEARMLFAGLWLLADREGRLLDNVPAIHGAVFPFEPSFDVNSLLIHLSSRGFVQRYERDGVRVVRVCAFDKHQHPHAREAASSLPPPMRKRGPKGAAEGAPRARPEALPKARPAALPKAVVSPSDTDTDTDTALALSSKELAQRARAPADNADPERVKPGIEGEVCLALRRAGLAAVNPSHPTLHALVAAGAMPDEFVAAASTALTKRDPFAYVLGVVEGRRRDAVQVANGVHVEPPAWHASHDGIVNRAAFLGIESQGVEETWPAFRRRVIEANAARFKVEAS